MINDSFSVNDEGHLSIGGVDALDLAERFKTPLYVMDEGAIRGACKEFRRCLEQSYEDKCLVAYASKAFSCKEIYRIMKSEGLGADVVSGGELYTALSVDFPPENIFFHGNNKTEDELRYALKSDVGTIVVDNLEELRSLENIAAERGKTQKILLRVKPGVDAHTHNFIRTGQIDSKFGFALETGEAMAAVKRAAGMPHVELCGIHCHIGSQIFDIEPFCEAASVMIAFMGRVATECGTVLTVLNLGGGFGIRYIGANDPPILEDCIKQICETVRAECREQQVPAPMLVIEPGRAIVAPAGATLYTIGSIKDIPKVRTFVSVDGGMTDNPRFALYQADCEAVVAQRAGEPKNRKITVAGRCCESGDILAEDVFVQNCSAGDVLAVLCTGAYNYSMASNYNRVRRPSVVMVRDGEARIIVERESYEDIIKNDL